MSSRDHYCSVSIITFSTCVGCIKRAVIDGPSCPSRARYALRSHKPWGVIRRARRQNRNVRHRCPDHRLERGWFMRRPLVSFLSSQRRGAEPTSQNGCPPNQHNVSFCCCQGPTKTMQLVKVFVQVAFHLSKMFGQYGPKNPPTASPRNLPGTHTVKILVTRMGLKNSSDYNALTVERCIYDIYKQRSIL